MRDSGDGSSPRTSAAGSEASGSNRENEGDAINGAVADSRGGSLVHGAWADPMEDDIFERELASLLPPVRPCSIGFPANASRPQETRGAGLVSSPSLPLVLPTWLCL